MPILEDARLVVNYLTEITSELIESKLIKMLVIKTTENPSNSGMFSRLAQDAYNALSLRHQKSTSGLVNAKPGYAVERK